MNHTRTAVVNFLGKAKYGLLILFLLELIGIVIFKDTFIQIYSSRQYPNRSRSTHLRLSASSSKNASINEHFNVNSTGYNTLKTIDSETLSVFDQLDQARDTLIGVQAAGKFDFKEINQKSVYTFYNVCIEEMDRPIVRVGLHENYEFIESQRIVIYNSRRRLVKNYVTVLQRQTISVAGPRYIHWNYWDVYFTNRSIPNTHTVNPTTAFFIVQTTFPSNLYHFWNEEFVDLFSVVRDTNRLHPGMQNQILYRHPRTRLSQFRNDTRDVCRLCRQSLYDVMLRTLHTTGQFYMFYHLPPNTCYTSAVFGARNSAKKMRDSVEHVLRELNMTPVARPRNTNVVIIKRNCRRILNIFELAKEARKLGFKNVDVVSFESLSVIGQIQKIIDTDILIGVQGAGLQWAIFMRPGSTLVEITWPKKHWGLTYTFVHQYEIKHQELRTDDVLVNWHSYEKHIRGGRVCSPEEKQHLLTSTPDTNNGDNVWKYADVRVDVDSFKTLLYGFV